MDMDTHVFGLSAAAVALIFLLFSTYAMLVPVATHICSLISACLHSLRAIATYAVVVTFASSNVQYSLCKLSNIYEHLNDDDERYACA